MAESSEENIRGTSTPRSNKLPFDNVLSENFYLGKEGFKSIIETDIQQNTPIGLSKVLSRSVYPPDYILAQLASRVYEERGKDGQELPEFPGWKLLTTEKGSQSYFGAAYWNSDNQNVVIAHRGTDSLGALWTDLRGILQNNYDPQMSSAATFASEVIAVLNELNKKHKHKNVNLQLSFTGHSLGGWLAQITAFTTKYLIKKDKIFLKNQNLQENDNHTHTVVSGGFTGMLGYVEHTQQRREQKIK